MECTTNESPEQELLKLWRRILNADVTAQTNFFRAGGHSLLAAKLAQDIEELTGLHLDLPEIFSYPTPQSLAKRLAEISVGGAGVSPASAAISIAPAMEVTRSAFASWGPALTCYTGALGVYLAVEHDRWWRLLAEGAPYLGLSPAAGGLFRFEHHPRPPARLVGLRCRGADDWEAAWAGIRSELAAAGRVIIAADAWNVPWLTSYERKHGPHWFVLARDEAGYVVDDPLDLVDDLGRQSPVRVHMDEGDLSGCCGALVNPAPQHVLREEVSLGTSGPVFGPAYRWLERGRPSPGDQAIMTRHGAFDLADRFEGAAGDPATYFQVDDIWQALRQRELLSLVLERETELGELPGLPAREAWEPVTALWRRLPPLLMHAGLVARTGTGAGSADSLVETLRAIGKAESELAADRFPQVMFPQVVP